MRFNDKDAWLALGFLAATVWVAHFLNFLHFGLYEDDYAVVSGLWRLPDFLENTRSALMDWPQGRPIGYLVLGIFSFVGEKLGGLPVIYMTGFAIVTLNAFLFYLLLRRIGTHAMAVTGALAFALFPADTTQTFLTHSLSLQVSITFLLMATLLYLSGRNVLSYLTISGSLLTYESPYLVFLAVPLLGDRWDRALAKKLFRHAAILAGIVLVAVIIRIAAGEERVAEMRADIPDVLMKIAKAIVIGPAVSMAQFGIAPIRAVLNWNWLLTVVAGASLAVFTWMLRRQPLAARVQNAPSSGVRPLPIGQLCLAGLAMLALAYGLSFTHFPPTATYGRPTSVHLAATLGGSLVFACLGAQFLSLADRFRLRTHAILLLALYFSLVMAYRLLIQDDFKRAWQNQRALWTAAIALLPDITEDTVVFVHGEELPKTAFILSYSWADPIILGQLFDFPKQWTQPPRLFVVSRAWPQAMVREGNHLRWMVPDGIEVAHWETMPDGNLIVLEAGNGRLVRRFGSINTRGVNLNLKSVPADPKPSFVKGPLYRYLIRGASNDNAPSAEDFNLNLGRDSQTESR